jgi:hypothetical protein
MNPRPRLLILLGLLLLAACTLTDPPPTPTPVPPTLPPYPTQPSANSATQGTNGALNPAGLLVLTPSPTGPGAFACPVTPANGSTPPGEAPSSRQYGNGALWTVLPEGGALVITPDQTGALVMKFPWWRAVTGGLVITGRRLDAPAPPLQASIPDGYGESGSQASGLIFPGEGCWEVTGRAGEGALTFVVSVRRAAP